MTGRSGFITNLIASFFCWLAVLLVHVVAGEGFVQDIAILAAFGTMVALWLVWAFSNFGTKAQEMPAEKGKRAAGSDARLALLMELMDEDERQTLKRRLLDDLQTDGETFTLDELLADDPKAKHNFS